MSYRIMSYHITSCHIMSYHVISNHISDHISYQISYIKYHISFIKSNIKYQISYIINHNSYMNHISYQKSYIIYIYISHVMSYHSITIRVMNLEANHTVSQPLSTAHHPTVKWNSLRLNHGCRPDIMGEIMWRWHGCFSNLT